MATRKIKKPKSPNPFVSISDRGSRSSPTTFMALQHPTYSRKEDKGKKLDLEIRTLKNHFRNKKYQEQEDEELAGIEDTWRDTEGKFKPIRKSPTVSGSLNELKGGKRKRNSTKKKRYNATKKKRSKK